MNKGTLEVKSLYEYVSYSKNENDFYNRLDDLCGIIAMEVSERVSTELKFPFQCVSIIESINEDVEKTIDLINDSIFFKNQPKVINGLLMKLISVYSPELYSKYKYYKYVIVN